MKLKGKMQPHIPGCLLGLRLYQSKKVDIFYKGINAIILISTFRPRTVGENSSSTILVIRQESNLLLCDAGANDLTTELRRCLTREKRNLCYSVVRSLNRHLKGVDLIPVRGLIVDDGFFQLFPV